MTVDTLISFLMWCTILNGAVLTLSSCIFLCFRHTDWCCQFYCRLYGISKDALSSIGAMFIGIYKMVWITFNLIPYGALLIIKHLY